MKQRTKFLQKQEPLAETQSQAQVTREFLNADEMLRFDAAQTSVPPIIARRLQKTLPPAARPWWKNLFGG
ncbi:MAG: hypothetical protein WCH99_16940 [Verrucomicrobiota bacterium]